MQNYVPGLEGYIPTAIIIFVIYIAANVAIGIWGMRKIKSADSYYTSGHSMGSWAVALAFGATCYSATLIIGSGERPMMWARPSCGSPHRTYSS